MIMTNSCVIFYLTVTALHLSCGKEVLSRSTDDRSRRRFSLFEIKEQPTSIISVFNSVEYLT